MPRIPRHFHFVFGLHPQREEFSPAYYLCLESCLRVNRPERIFFHYHHEPHGLYWDLIRDRLELVRVSPNRLVEAAEYTDAFIGQGLRYAHHTDFIRLEVLREHGGVYADIDTLFLRPLPGEFYEKEFVLGREGDVRDPVSGKTAQSLCNALLMSEPGARFARTWLERMPGAFDGSWSNHSCLLAHALSVEFPDQVHIEPATSFYPYMWTREGLRALLEENHGEWFGAYSVHLWSHLWWAKNRKDFCKFSGCDLTEKFIRSVDTTYTRAARPYLPSRWHQFLGRCRRLFRG
jgi:hypothetical protein